MRTSNHSIFHVILVSNEEKKFLTRVNQDMLFSYLHGMLFRMHCKVLAISGYANHVHIVLNISPDVSINQLIRELQQNSVDFLRCERSVFPAFYGWNPDFYYISCHPSQKEELTNHIKNQFNYHQTKSFEEELEELAIYIE
jgi:putative transposase